MDDITLQRDVMAELEWDPSIEASEIGVLVKDGVVTLNGHAHTFWERRAAERDAARISGVKAVANEIEVNAPRDEQHYSDSDVAHAVVNALQWNPSLPKNCIKVTVDDGWVTLDGSVCWQYQKDAAQHSLDRLRGVKGVNNLIAVVPQTSAVAIERRIQSALERRADLDAQNIRVEADGRKVRLQGNVSTWIEREAADKVAWSAPGVAEVDNQIVVGS
jgi:osmotically-inducible protein OsmY